MQVSRKRLAGAVLLVGALIVGGRLMKSCESLASVEIRYEIGAAKLESLEAKVRPTGADEVVAAFRTELTTPTMIQRTRLRPGTYDLEVTLVTRAGTTTTKRRLEVRRGADIRVDLTQETP